jgi:hypothetical protein
LKFYTRLVVLNKKFHFLEKWNFYITAPSYSDSIARSDGIAKGENPQGIFLKQKVPLLEEVELLYLAAPYLSVAMGFNPS